MTAHEQAIEETKPAAPGMEMFTFGEPVAMLDKREILDYVESYWNGKWYEPPVCLDGLAKSFRANAHHSSAIYVKRNILLSTFVPSRYLGREQFSRLALDLLVMGNAYLEELLSRTSKLLELKPAMAKYTRLGQQGRCFFVQGYQQEHEFQNRVLRLQQPDVNQEIYGVPEYMAALHSAWLNESATLFRRKYYQNGSHAGFILYMTDAAQEQGDVEAMREALKNSKGPGNFRNLFMYAPNGKKDGIQLIPVSEVSAKDDFFNIKNVTRDDILAAHRVPPQLMGIVPNNTGGFGDVEKAAKVFVQNELVPLQAIFLSINEQIGQEVVKFQQYQVGDAPSA